MLFKLDTFEGQS